MKYPFDLTCPDCGRQGKPTKTERGPAYLKWHRLECMHCTGLFWSRKSQDLKNFRIMIDGMAEANRRCLKLP